jgi:hypothetical protein
VSDQFEDMRALERAIRSAGSATGIWTCLDPETGRWRRMLYYVENVSLGTTWQGVYDLWETEIEAVLGLSWDQNVSYDQARFLGMVPGDVDNASPLIWADCDPAEYPRPEDVPPDPALYTVVMDLQGERFMTKRMGRNWLDVELYVVQHYMDQGAIPGYHFLVGATIKGYDGCFEPASMVYTTRDGQPPPSL